MEETFGSVLAQGPLSSVSSEVCGVFNNRGLLFYILGKTKAISVAYVLGVSWTVLTKKLKEGFSNTMLGFL